MCSFSVTSYLFKYFSCRHQICWSFGVRQGKLQGSVNHLFDITPRFYLARVPAILSDDCRLIWYILKPMDKSWLLNLISRLEQAEMDWTSYSVREPRSSPLWVKGLRPAKQRTGTLPIEALWMDWPNAKVPQSTWTSTHCLWQVSVNASLRI